MQPAESGNNRKDFNQQSFCTIFTWIDHKTTPFFSHLCAISPTLLTLRDCLVFFNFSQVQRFRPIHTFTSSGQQTGSWTILKKTASAWIELSFWKGFSYALDSRHHKQSEVMSWVFKGSQLSCCTTVITDTTGNVFHGSTWASLALELAYRKHSYQTLIIHVHSNECNLISP